MKSIKIFFASLLILVSLSVRSQSNCDGIYPVDKGTEYQWQNFDEYNRIQSTIHITVLDKRTVGNGMEADIKSEQTDPKGVLLHTTQFTMKCTGNNTTVDISNYLDPIQMAGWANKEVKMDGNSLSYPNYLTAGVALTLGAIRVKVTTNGSPFATMDVKMSGRKVEAQESQTCPVGTFDCYKVSYLLTTTTQTLGNTVVAKIHCVEWMNKGYGMIRREAHDDAGNLLWSSVLSSIKKAQP